ncbi:unnamed protein product [Prorocentrum cordatum]|uniref:Uncharacterized protein n=1 Tax=Prorocentrum cordatum TaxID=2364126 RepID=A0ABN9WC78_9DINO|nr:unnamed protein product [Polarella glacialis]
MRVAPDDLLLVPSWAVVLERPRVLLLRDLPRGRGPWSSHQRRLLRTRALAGLHASVWERWGTPRSLADEALPWAPLGTGFARRGGAASAATKGEQKAAKGLSVKDKRLRELLALTLEQTLGNTQKVRMTEGILLDTTMSPKSHKLVQATQEEQGAFAQRVGSCRKAEIDNPVLEPLGPPHAMIFAALVETAAALEACGGENQKSMLKPSENIIACGKAEDAEQLARMCRPQETTQDDQTNVVLAVQMSVDWRCALIDGLRQAGRRRLRGAAPAGRMEEELQEWTEWLEANLIA